MGQIEKPGGLDFGLYVGHPSDKCVVFFSALTLTVELQGHNACKISVPPIQNILSVAGGGGESNGNWLNQVQLKIGH